jgi:hypothetical protein
MEYMGFVKVSELRLKGLDIPEFFQKVGREVQEQIDAWEIARQPESKTLAAQV